MAPWFESARAEDYRLPEETIERTPTPALVVSLPHVRENVRRVLAYTGGAERWRPHVKTTKTPEIWRELTRAGVWRFKCATTREARHLLALLRAEGVGGADVLLAYPLLGPGLAELGRLARSAPGIRVSVLCEDPRVVERVAPELGIFVDVDTGMRRTGVPLDDRARILAVCERAGARLEGVHFYEGHLASGPLDQRRRAAFACYDALLELVAALRARGVAIGELCTSGTPGFLHALAYEPFGDPALPPHRVSPGTVVLHDQRSEADNPDLDLVPAAYVLTRVVSQPAPGVVTCDAGAKSLGADAGDPCGIVLGRPELEPLGLSEEHLPLRVSGGARPELGETLMVVPRHVCTTVNLAEELLLVDGEAISVVSVRARAHDLTLPEGVH